MASFGKFHEAVVDWGAVEFIVQDGSIKEDNALELTHGVETSTSAQALLGIFAVGKKLELVRNAARNNNIITDEASLSNFNEARIHQGGSIDVNLTFLISGDERVFAALERQNRSFPQNNKHNNKHT